MTPLVWILIAGMLGFAVTALFAGLLKLSRSWLLVPYLGLVGAFMALYFRSAQIDLGPAFSHSWPWGLLGALLVGAFMIRNIASQPPSVKPVGADRAAQIAWWGVVYGGFDALFLSVMPVFAAQQLFAALAWSGTWYGVLLSWLVALVASAYVTIAYHLGYPEFRNRTVLLPVIGNTIITLAMLATGSPLAAIISHAIMHIAAVLHGAEATIQLPPHYGSAVSGG